MARRHRKVSEFSLVWLGSRDLFIFYSSRMPRSKAAAESAPSRLDGEVGPEVDGRSMARLTAALLAAGILHERFVLLGRVWALVFSVFLGDWSCGGLSYCLERGRFGLAREPRLLRILHASILLVGVRASVPARAAISLSRNSSGASRSLSRSARGMASFVAQLYFVLGR